MERTVKIYKGSQISKHVLDRIKEIVLKSSYSKYVYEKYYQEFSNISEIAADSDSEVCENVVVIGEDWFFHYVDTKEDIHFVEWVAAESLDKERKIVQTIEMLHYLKRTLISNYYKDFYAAIRHDTAYQIYLKMIEKNYFISLFDVVEIDSIYSKLKEIKLEYRIHKIYKSYVHGKINDINVAIDNDKVLSPEYLNAVLHFVQFSTSQKFQDKYCKKKKY